MGSSGIGYTKEKHKYLPETADIFCLKIQNYCIDCEFMLVCLLMLKNEKKGNMMLLKSII
jgi:hypothetical protein